MNLKYILIVVALAIIAGGGILIYQYLLVPEEALKIPEIKSPEERIQTILPPGIFLREFELIPNISPESYLIIYIEDPKFDEVPAIKKGLFMSCPDSTEGQAIDGIYHLALFQNNSIINDFTIPSGSLVFADPEQAGMPLPPRQKLVFKNTKLNIHWKFGGAEPVEAEQFDLQIVDLIKLEDLNGDGQKLEFKLTGPTTPCGHTQYLIAGYDKENNRAIIYPIIKDNQASYWHDNFLPDTSGRVEWYFRCGDHGNNIEEYELYQFDSQKKAYILQEERRTPCFEDETTKWSIYKNDFYHFQLNIPEGWAVKDLQRQDNIPAAALSSPDNAIIIEIVPEASAFMRYDKEAKMTKVQVGKYTATRTSYTVDNKLRDGFVELSDVPRQKSIYFGSKITGDISKNDELFLKILRTFQYTQEELSLDKFITYTIPSNWERDASRDPTKEIFIKSPDYKEGVFTPEEGTSILILRSLVGYDYSLQTLLEDKFVGLIDAKLVKIAGLDAVDMYIDWEGYRRVLRILQEPYLWGIYISPPDRHSQEIDSFISSIQFSK